MKAILHIGTEKTGTTTLQNFLVKNKPAFSEKGYYIPESVGVGNNRGLASCSMQAGKLDDYYYSRGVNSQCKRESFDQELMKAFYKEIESLDGSYHTVILSSEHFHSRCVTNNEIKNVKNILAPLFEEFEIVVYLRPQIDMAISLYSTHLRSGSSSEFDEFLHNHCRPDNPYYNYSQLLDKWESVFGEQILRVRIFNRENMLNGDIVDDFFNTINFKGELESFERVKNLNESLTPFGQEILRLSNKYDFSFIVDGIAFKNRLLKLVNEEFIGKGCSPNAMLAANIQKFFEKSNMAVAQKWFAREQLFDLDIGSYGEGRKLESEYKAALEFFFSCYQNVTQKEVDAIRDAALAVEKVSIVDAAELMKIALKLRPSGKLLKNKLKEYDGSL